MAEKETDTFNEEIIDFKAFKKRSAVHITLKYENLTQDDINDNIMPRLKRTLENFDALWTSCKNIPAPIKEREILLKIVVFDEPKERFKSKYGYNVLGFTYPDLQEKKYLAECWVYRANKEGPADISALEHEFGHALTIYWMGKKTFSVSTYFCEGSAELIAHGGNICSYLQKILEKHKQDDLSLEAIKIIGLQPNRKPYNEFYELPYIKLAYLRKKDPQLFGKLIDYLMQANTEGAERLNKKFSKGNNELFKEWIKKHRVIRVEDPNYVQCMVNFYGSFYTLEELFKYQKIQKVLEIWGISNVEELNEKVVFSDKIAINHFIKNINKIADTTHLKYVCKACGLASLMSDQSYCLEKLRKWKEYLVNKFDKKKDSLAGKLFFKVSNSKEGTIFTLLRTCELLKECKTFDDFRCFCKVIKSIIKNERLCQSMLTTKDYKTAFKKEAQSRFSTVKKNIKEADNIQKSSAMRLR